MLAGCSLSSPNTKTPSPSGLTAVRGLVLDGTQTPAAAAAAALSGTNIQVYILCLFQRYQFHKYCLLHCVYVGAENVKIL